MIIYRSGDDAKVQDNTQVTDVVLLLMVTKMGKGKYKICHVKKMFPDSYGIVRLVAVEIRPTNNK